LVEGVIARFFFGIGPFGLLKIALTVSSLCPLGAARSHKLASRTEGEYGQYLTGDKVVGHGFSRDIAA
jgi:hypothetical protein